MRSAKKKKITKQESPAKPKTKSEKTENIVAITIFVLLIIIGIGIFTKGFGLLEKNKEDAIRIRVPLGNDPYIGSPNASVLIIAFSDYECPFCARAELTMRELLEKYKDKVVYVFKDYPLIGIHPNAYNASLAAECAKEQDKFWEYHNYLYDHHDQLSIQYLKEYARLLELDTEQFNTCFETQKYKSEVEKDIQTAKLVVVTGTPTVFINGIRVIGAQPEETFIKIISEELKTKK